LLWKRIDHNPVDESVRRILVSTLYTQPSSLLGGVICGVLTGVIAASDSRNPLMIVLAIALAIVGTARVIESFIYANRAHQMPVADVKRRELIYEAGAFTYSTLIGLIAGLAIYLQIDRYVELLALATAIAYGVSVSARNAGRPAIAIGQLCLSVLPSAIAALSIGDIVMFVLAVNLVLLIPSMVSITFNVFNQLRDSIHSAEANAGLADKMQMLARTDVVTGLANRAGLNHELVEALMALPDDRKLTLIWLDLDRFKEVNDTLGHPVGDRVLSEVARRLRSVVPEGALVSRFGGDEFIVAFEVAHRAKAERLAGAVLEAINRPMRLDGERLEIGASLGVAMLPDDGADLDTLMKSADLALYHAKIGGRNQTSFFDSSMNRDLVRRKEIETELRSALRRDELSVFFQPIVDLKTGHIRTFEALVRWFHPEKGELRPDEFIPVAEETGVIITLGNWITAQAAKACARWPENVSIAVNLSPSQIRAPGAALGILNALREAQLDPSRLELEITETVLLDHNENTARFIDELSAAGVRFALDDFGTGYSSLSYINKYPFRKIKVDRSFVSGPDVGKKSDAIIRAVAEMATQLEMDIVAEGLETLDQVRAVGEAGCTLGQGYYFSRAVPDYLAAMLIAQDNPRSAHPGANNEERILPPPVRKATGT
jgi:diguanylate cyclase (GGDEF)-like protein